MATTNIKKNASGYGYQYTDLAEIHNYLEANNMSYYQYIEPIDGVDYIMTVPIIDGKEQPPRRGCRLLDISHVSSGKTNVFQNYGSMLTYFRRYSVLSAFGLACSDNDAALLTRNPDDIDTQTINKVQAKTLLGIAQSKGHDAEWVLARGGVSKLGELTNRQYADIMSELENL